MIFQVVSLCFCFKGISSFLNQDEIQISFDSIKELEIRQCILAGNHDNLISVIKKFSSENIQITYLSYTRLTDYIGSTENADSRTGVILKDENLFAFEEISRVFERANKSYKFGNFIWLAFPGNRTEKLPIKELVIPFDCEFIMIQSTNQTSYKLTEIYTVKNRFFSIEFGTWEKDIGLKTLNTSFYKRRSNFQNTEIRYLSSIDMNHVRNIGHNEMITQMDEIVDGFAYMMNLTYFFDVRKSSSDQYKTLRQIGDISDMMSLFDINNIFGDKMGPIFKIRLNWYIKYPSVALRSDYYLQPFDTNLWLLLFSEIILGTVLILIIRRQAQTKKRLLIDDLFLGLESFCNQCGNIDIENVSLRFVCILHRLTALILIGLYGAIITSFFAVEIFRPPFTNLEQFFANGEYLLLASKFPDLRELMLDSNSPYKKLSENFTKFIQVNHFAELFQEICYGKYVALALVDDPIHYKLPCIAYKIPENLGSFWFGVLLQKNSPFTKIFSENLVRFYEIGFQMRFRKMELHDSSKLFEENSFQPIKMEQMTQVLSITIIGILLGMGIIIIEIMNKRLCSKQIRPK